MASSDLPLNVPLRAVTEHFSCPICICQLTETLTTPCGHRFCAACIKESLDRHHKCPICNKPTRQADLIRDPQFDSLIAAVIVEKEKAEKEYFDKLISDAAAQQASDLDNQCGAEHFSPVESVLKKHLKVSLAAHQQYYEELSVGYSRRVVQTEAECNRMIVDLHSQGLSQQELDQQTADLRDTWRRQKETLHADMMDSTRLLADAYDKYLTEHIPSLSVLPVKISINLLSKNIRIPDIQLNPEDGMDVLKTTIESYMEQQRDKVLSYGDDITYVCFGPFAKRSSYEMHQMAADVIELGTPHPDIFILPSTCKPVLQYALKPGSEIAIYGKIQCQSDLPKCCFAVSFIPEDAQTVDYFSCKDCNFNWVCRTCMEVCHKEHQVVPYIMNHQPTWACCYCPKKKKVPTATLR